MRFGWIAGIGCGLGGGVTGLVAGYLYWFMVNDLGNSAVAIKGNMPKRAMLWAIFVVLLLGPWIGFLLLARTSWHH